MPVTINQGRIDLSFHHCVGEVFQYVFERLGHTVSSSAAPHAAAFEALGAEKSDLLVGWFDGSHGEYIEPLRKQVEHLSAEIYNPYCIWGVPWYVPASVVPSVESLAQPEVAKKFATGADGKHIIQGIAPGAGISRFSREMIDKYGLAAQGWEFRNGSQEDCFGAFEQAVEKEEWVVVPLWHPQYLHAHHSIRALEEPHGLLRPVDEAQLVINKTFLAKMSEEERVTLLKVCKRVTLGNPAVTEMDSGVHVSKISPRASARKWISQNLTRVDSWFDVSSGDPEELAKDVSSYLLPGESAQASSRKFELPSRSPGAAGAYLPFSISSNKLIQTSFQLPWELPQLLPSDAPKLAYQGPVGEGGTNEADALASVRICALNLISQLRDAAGGDLARVQLLRLEGYVAVKQGGKAVDVPRILNAASLLVKHVLGPVRGNHARTALVLTENPLDVPTMLGATAELLW